MKLYLSNLTGGYHGDIMTLYREVFGTSNNILPSEAEHIPT